MAKEEKKQKKDISSDPVSEKKPMKKIPSGNSDEKGLIPRLFSLVIWITGVIVSLSVGFGMIGGTLSLPAWLGGDIVAMIAGWIVVITTLLGVVLAVLNKA